MDVFIVSRDGTEIPQDIGGINAGSLAGPADASREEGGEKQGLPPRAVLHNVDELVTGDLDPRSDEVQAAGRVCGLTVNDIFL